jgi:hypothetical protein
MRHLNVLSEKGAGYTHNVHATWSVRVMWNSLQRFLRVSKRDKIGYVINGENFNYVNVTMTQYEDNQASQY